ncbi:MAG TPA: flippase [Acidimicrobiales bacterium]|jgi:O-antigen/teichoic acid export membrane protein|nr:flippase [Acidimicrobiales bacterium]
MDELADVPEPPAAERTTEDAAPGAIPPGTERRRVLLSTSSVMTSTLIVAALGGIALAFMTRRLGKSGYGEFVVAITFVSTATLVTDLGLNALTGREIARTPERAREILGHTLGLRVSLSVLVIPIVALIAHFAYGASNSVLFLSVVIASLAVPFDALRSVSLSYFVASIRNHIGAVLAILQQVLFVGGVVLILGLGRGKATMPAHDLRPVWCVSAYVASTVISSICAYVWVVREVPFRPRYGAAQWRRMVTGSIGIGVIQLINVLYLRADTLILSVMTTPAQVGIYGVAYAIIAFYGAFASIVMTSLLPILTRANDDELGGIVVRAVRHLITISVMLAMLTWCFGPIAIRLVAGTKYAAAYLPLAILATAMVFTYLHVALGVSSVARNRHHRIVYVSLACLVLNVVGNVLAIPRWGIDGSATVTLISEAVALLGVAYVFRHDVGPRIPWATVLPKPVLVGAALTVVFYFPLHSTTRGVVLSGALGVCQLAAYLAVLLAVSGLPDEYRSAITRVRRQITRTHAE